MSSQQMYNTVIEHYQLERHHDARGDKFAREICFLWIPLNAGTDESQIRYQPSGALSP